MAICNVTATATGADTITVNVSVSGLSSATALYYVKVTSSPSSSTKTSDTYTSVTSFSETFYFSGLESGTRYTFTAQVYANGAGTDVIGTDYDITEEAEPALYKWSWTSSNGNATDSQTRAAYDAITGNGAVSDFNYLVWNDLVDKVYETALAVGDDWDTQSNAFTTYNATRMSSSDRTLTAKRFNALRWNIGLHYSTDLKDVYAGDIVYGSYFITLTNCLNSWIDSM